MFIREKPKAAPVPHGTKASWVVRYSGGRKPFSDEGVAMSFARDERAKDKGWAEVTHVLERVVSPR